MVDEQDNSAPDPALAALARVRSVARSVKDWRTPKPVILTGSGPDDRDPQSLGTSIARWTDTHGYRAELAVAGLVGRWIEIVGADLAAHVSVRHYAGDTKVVTLLAESQDWEIQMRYLVPQVQRRFDEELGPGVVERIVITSPGRSRSKGRWSVRTGRRSPRQPPPSQPPPTQNEALFDGEGSGL